MSHPQVILTGDVSGGSRGGRIFRSSDFAKNFVQTELPFHPLAQISYHPQDSNRLLALSTDVRPQGWGCGGEGDRVGMGMWWGGDEGNTVGRGTRWGWGCRGEGDMEGRGTRWGWGCGGDGDTVGRGMWRGWARGEHGREGDVVGMGTRGTQWGWGRSGDGDMEGTETCH